MGDFPTSQRLGDCNRKEERVMDEVTLTNMKDLIESLKSAAINRKGWVLLPSLEGFDVYEFDADKLRSLVNVLGQDFTVLETGRREK